MKWSLMNNNITREDANSLINFLSQEPLPILTNSSKVREFEEKWNDWLGTKYSVFVNSGSSANILTFLALKSLVGSGEIITTPFGWVSDIAAILHAGFKPVFCDIKFSSLSIDEEELKKKITTNTKAILLTHILGYNGLSQEILNICKTHNILLIEDCCESHGATFENQKIGSFGFISNFSYYYAHHMTSIEGGMVCTNDEYVYNLIRSYRSHGMVREMDDKFLKNEISNAYPDLNPNFIFLASAYNMRSTELNAVLALNQLPRLDQNNIKRRENIQIFLNGLNPDIYFTDFDLSGNSNYAFTLLLRKPNFNLRNKIEDTLSRNEIEFRRGMSGGGNQLRQPYLRNLFDEEYKNYPKCDHVHHFGWYIGNYPELEQSNIYELIKLLNNIT